MQGLGERSGRAEWWRTSHGGVRPVLLEHFCVALEASCLPHFVKSGSGRQALQWCENIPNSGIVAVGGFLLLLEWYADEESTFSISNVSCCLINCRQLQTFDCNA